MTWLAFLDDQKRKKIWARPLLNENSSVLKPGPYIYIFGV